MTFPKLVATVRACLLVPVLLGVSFGSPAFAAEKELTWEELWPPGEDEVIQKLYDNHMQGLEDTLNEQTKNQTTLWELGKNGSTGSSGIDAIPEGSVLDQAVQIGTFNVVEELDGKLVKLPGYIVPLEFSSDNKYTEFLLVPYFGACLHAPPPPPNQTVFVRSSKPVTVKDLWNGYWVEGTMLVEKAMNEIGNAAYTIDAKKVTLYE